MALNFSGLFSGGNLFGGSEPETLSLPGLYSKEQAQAARDNARRQAVFSMAAKLLEAGNYSTTPRTLGSALAGGVMAGQQAYQNALNSNMTNRMNTLKMAEVIKGIQRDRQMREYGSKLYKAPTITMGPMTDSTSAVGRELISQGATGTDPEDLAFQAQNLAMTSEALNQNRKPGDADYQPLTVGEPTLDTSVLARMNALDPKATGEYLTNYKTMTELSRPDIKESGGILYAVSPDGTSVKPITTPRGEFTGDYKNAAIVKFGGATTMDGINQWIANEAQRRGVDPVAFGKQQMEDFQNYVATYAKAKAASVNLPAKTDETMAVGLARKVLENNEKIPAVQASTNLMMRLRRAVLSNPITGTAAQQRRDIANLLASVGEAFGADVSGLRDSVNKSDTDLALTAMGVLKYMATQGGARGFAGNETQILVNAFTNPNMGIEARLAAIDSIIQENVRLIESFNKDARNYELARQGKPLDMSVTAPSVQDLQSRPPNTLDALIQERNNRLRNR